MPEPEKATSRIAMNSRLIAVITAVFFLIINLKIEILTQNGLLALQLVLAIPFLFTSTLAYSKLGYRKETKRWNTLGWITFIIGYAFMLNTIGVLVGRYVDVLFGVLFFLANWILTIIYSLIDISYEKSVIKERLVKDSFFILIQIFFGLFILLGVF
ncbi:MAG: hypothetical protein KAT37_04065 [Candidatus Aenigmarchaeota archaeon]|nr:hypothetical protein [Candidatus Aenigmarchaeota archaeon]